MILTGKKIIDEVNLGAICIEPFDYKMANPNSFNYRLGKVIYEVTDEVIDAKCISNTKKIIIPPEGLVLLPGTLYLGVTEEKIGSSKYVTSLIGRSSIGRLGLFLQITADMGNLGKAHKWTLELKVVQKLRVYPHMVIGQVSFWKPKGTIADIYSGGYTNYSFPHKSNFYNEVTK